MAITYALMQRFEELAEKEPERIQLIKKAKVVKVNKDGNKATGVTYLFNDEEVYVEGPVILATGGYAADFGEDSLLKKHRPDTFHLASTNGTHATGDGHKMLMAMGANDIDMDKVQVHPTGLVDPKDPGSKWKFLAAEGMWACSSMTCQHVLTTLSSSTWGRWSTAQQEWTALLRRTWPPRLRFRRNVEGEGSRKLAHTSRAQLESLQRP